jgi:mycobactin lysine-N-oxygenase
VWERNVCVPVESDLFIIGAGAKSAAIAAKVHVINSLGLGPLALSIVEATEPAASWSGRNGLTSGNEPLAVTPVKDVGFPYQSYQAFAEVGEQIDGAMLEFSWHQYLISERRYARWIDAGLPAVKHRNYGQYLTWVLKRATRGVNLLSGRVTQAAFDADGERWMVDVTDSTGERAQHLSRAFVLTGPGIHRDISHDPDVASQIFHCDSRRVEFERIPREQGCDIAIVGGGESALSSLALLRGPRPEARFTVYTPSLPMSRGESFLENRVFSNPDEVDWCSLSLETRRDFIKHGDRGVFDPTTLSEIAYDDNCRFVTGRVMHVRRGSRHGRVLVDYTSSAGATGAEHDYVVNCTGFDLLAQLRVLLPSVVRAELESRAGQLWGRPPEAAIPIGRHLELQGLRPRLHMPGLAGLSQGPGFANLGSLGVLANRILQPLILDEDSLCEESAGTGSTTVPAPSMQGVAGTLGEVVLE